MLEMEEIRRNEEKKRKRRKHKGNTNSKCILSIPIKILREEGN